MEALALSSGVGLINGCKGTKKNTIAQEKSIFMQICF
jgi:hypothetical protein